ncbi:MAG: peptide deformylase [Candidatus Saccharibacteria bacterium]|nr:peptide deformylase [Candidatus Saccharibacteria bacterium]
MKSKIIRLPNPLLRQTSKKIGLINDRVKNLVAEMIDQAKAWEISRQHEITVGLAAIQIGQPLKIIIVRSDFNPQSSPDFEVLINPKITKSFGEQIIQPEGCLSVPNYYAPIQRFDKIQLTALNLDGQNFKIKAEGFAARVLQHEVDHLKGIMTVDQAVEYTDSMGQTFNFAQLNQQGQLEAVNQKEVIKSGILNYE